MPRKPVGDLRTRKQYTRVFTVLRDWMRVLRGAGRPARPDVTSQDEELRRLRTRVQELEEERDLLGKAMAFFAKRNG